MSLNSSKSRAVIVSIMILLVFSTVGNAKKHKPKQNDPQDTIEVVGHIPLTGGPVRSFLTTRHYSNYYVYAEHEAGKAVTLIDVSNISKPIVLADVSYPSGGANDMFAVAGTAALVTEQQQSSAPSPAPQTIRIMNFTDPEHPTVAREFTGVTAISRDDSRGLIFLANPDGVWVLHQSLALDPEVEREYAHHVIYDH